MQQVLRLVAMAIVFVVASVGWLVLGVVMSERSSAQRYDLSGAVADLWGAEIVQDAPTVAFEWPTWAEEETPVRDERGEVRTVTRRVQRVAGTGGASSGTSGGSSPGTGSAW